MDDIEYLCNRVIVINHGQIIMDGTIEDLQKQIGLPSMIRVKFKQKPNVQNLVQVEKLIVEEDEVFIHYDRYKTSAPHILSAVGKWGELLIFKW
jgi:ABC-2 type transport system ATP-binding protein